jgi:hypothetical protein
MDDELKSIVTEGVVAGVCATLLLGVAIFPEKANQLIYSAETRIRGLFTVARR